MLLKAAESRYGNGLDITIELRSTDCGHYHTHVFVTQHHPTIDDSQNVYEHALKMWNQLLREMNEPPLAQLTIDELANIDRLESEASNGMVSEGE